MKEAGERQANPYTSKPLFMGKKSFLSLPSVDVFWQTGQTKRRI